jgi:hypothetical protein
MVESFSCSGWDDMMGEEEREMESVWRDGESGEGFAGDCGCTSDILAGSRELRRGGLAAMMYAQTS